LLRDGTEIKGSRIDGLSEVVSLSELLNDLKRDAIRWVFASTPLDTALDVDIDRLQRPDSSNPLYAIGYAQSICRWSAENTGSYLGDSVSGRILAFPEIVRQAAENLAPHTIAEYLVTLSREWTQVIGEGNRPALVLTRAVAKTLEQGLHLLEIDIQDENA
jgi:arginyl-tRNA synthetase